MNRAQRRAGRIRGPKGEWLYPHLLLVQARDAKGRPTEVRIAYDEETIGDVIPEERQGKGEKAEMLLVWMGEGQGAIS